MPTLDVLKIASTMEVVYRRDFPGSLGSLAWERLERFSKFHWVQVSFSGFVGMHRFYALINVYFYISNSKSHWFFGILATI